MLFRFDNRFIADANQVQKEVIYHKMIFMYFCQPNFRFYNQKTKHRRLETLFIESVFLRI